MKLLFDENFNQYIIRAVRLRLPDAVLDRVQDVGLRTLDDETILEFAANSDYVLITHDARTIEPRFKSRIAAGWTSPGVVLIRQEVPIGRAIDDLVIFVECSEAHEWDNQFVRIPLQ